MKNKQLKKNLKNRYYLSSNSDINQLKTKANLNSNNRNYQSLRRENTILRFATIIMIVAIFAVSILLPNIIQADTNNNMSFDSTTIKEQFELSSDDIRSIKRNQIPLSKTEEAEFIKKFNSLTLNYLIPVLEVVSIRSIQYEIRFTNGEFENIIFYLNDIVRITLNGKEYYFLIPSSYQTIC